MPHLPYAMAAWVRRDYLPFVPKAGGRTGPEVIKARELPLTFISHRTQERRPCTLSWQHSRANHVGGGVCDPALKLGAWASCVYYSSVIWLGEEEDMYSISHHPLPPVADEGANRTSHSTQKNGSYSPPGKHSRGDFIDRGAGERALKV